MCVFIKHFFKFYFIDKSKQLANKNNMRLNCGYYLFSVNFNLLKYHVGCSYYLHRRM